MPTEVTGFVATMNATGPWRPAPAVLTGAQPSGPVEHGLFADTVFFELLGLEIGGARTV